MSHPSAARAQQCSLLRLTATLPGQRNVCISWSPPTNVGPWLGDITREHFSHSADLGRVPDLLLVLRLRSEPGNRAAARTWAYLTGRPGRLLVRAALAASNEVGARTPTVVETCAISAPSSSLRQPW
eukprot:3940957-Rhodomonas_salina.4